MKRLLLVLVLATSPVWVVAQGPTGQGSGASRAALAQLVSDYWEWRLVQRPELATQVGRSDYNDRWRDLSKAAREKAREKRHEFLQRASALSPGALTDAERLSVQLLEYELRAQIDNEAFLELVTLSQQGGAHTHVFTTISQMPTRSVKDYENIIARLQAVPAYVDQLIALASEQMAAGLVQPAIVVDLILDQMTAQRRPPAAESPLLIAFQQFPDSMTTPDRQRLRAAAASGYEQAFVPAWQRLETFLRNTYRPKARPSIALSSLPGGRELYEKAIRYHVTLPMTAGAIHQIGLDEVARIDRRIEQIARAQGFTGSANEFEKQLGARPGATFASQEEMLAFAKDVLSRLEPEMPKLFRWVPRMKVDVRPIPADREASTASSYSVGTVDGSRPAWFNMNTYRPREQVRYRTEALVLHETVPGHHLQVALMRELPDLPDFRRSFAATAFTEGWALYAESSRGRSD